MAKQQDLTKLGDDELMTQWTNAAKLLDEAKGLCKEFSAEYHTREMARQEAELAERKRSADAGERDASLDQTVGSVRA